LILAAAVLLLAIHTPEECLVVKGTGAVQVEHAGKTYQFRYADCRDEFLADPERFAQLYDALLELAAEGAVLETAPPSLVPS
jgi:YHS domain-containing protein